MNFENQILLGIFDILFAIAIKTDGIYKILLMKNKRK